MIISVIIVESLRWHQFCFVAYQMINRVLRCTILRQNGSDDPLLAEKPEWLGTTKYGIQT